MEGKDSLQKTHRKSSCQTEQLETYLNKTINHPQSSQEQKTLPRLSYFTIRL